MNVQRATATLALAACVGVAFAGTAEATPHQTAVTKSHHVRHVRRVHHVHHALAHHKQAAHNALSHTAVMNAGDMVETNLPMDSTVTVNGIEAGCTGIGINAREDPRWTSFPVRVEFSGAYHQYIPGGSLVVKDEDRKPLLHVRCDAPWVLLRLEPGKYRMAGLMVGYSQPQSWVMKIKHNCKNPRRIVFHFDEVGSSTP
jgi:hypothetical protein